MAIPIEAAGLSKVYSTRFGSRRFTALEGLDLRVEQGQVFGLLGPNGAGKTTTVKILLGLTRPTAGRASLLGLAASDPESRRRVGYLPEGHRFPGYLDRPPDALDVRPDVGHRRRGAAPARGPELLERVKLTAWADVRVKKFSKGMTQRLGLASALIHDPEVLLLDEPTDGVDPVGRREIRDLLREEAARGKTVLLNSHLLSEIERTCDRVAVLRAGKIAAAGRIEDLTAAGRDTGSWRRESTTPCSPPFARRRFRRARQRAHRPDGEATSTTSIAWWTGSAPPAERSRSSRPCARASKTFSSDLVREGEPAAPQGRAP